MRTMDLLYWKVWQITKECAVGIVPRLTLRDSSPKKARSLLADARGKRR